MSAPASPRRRAGRRGQVFILLGVMICLVAGLVVPPVLFGTDRAMALADDSQMAPLAPVWVTQAEGVIDPALSGFLVRTMEEAAEAGAAALIIELDTPGGLDTSMRSIIQAQIDSPIPFVIYVYPQGARAASAGVYILLASDVAAMAPQTNLGAATPVSLTGDMDDVMRAKVTNDAAAYIRGLASNHGRNADWAEQAVRESVSLTAEEALEQGVIEFIAPDLDALLQAIDGYVTVPKGLTLHTVGAPVEEVKMGWITRFLHAIASPDIAYILLTLGVLGIIAEINSPGFGGAGIGGVIALLLAFYSFQVLPVNYVGVALIVLAMALLVAEIFIQSGGVLGIGGVAALVAGGLFLFEDSAPYFGVSWPVLAVVGICALLFFFVVIMAISRARHRPVAVGVEDMVGATGVALSVVDPWGQVRLRGETWKARTEGESLHKDERIEVLRTEGLTLIVRRAAEPEAPEADTENKPGQQT
jgi:membrane-bound serine protease (ClpP class)